MLKQPPFSYACLIKMALHSRDDHKMLLREIFYWIEDMFPYYKYTSNTGWRNSICSVLSWDNIFVREPAKPYHKSYWTMKSDVKSKLKPRPQHNHTNTMKQSNSSAAQLSLSPLPLPRPIIPLYSSVGQLSTVPTTDGNKKVLQLLLPQPEEYTPNTDKVYYLIPITGINQPPSNL